ncbi:MAG: 5'-nucleotidase C-terminal domain-containing protein, partial [Muribaculaceae bacterium]|nr:5'-nucleotidase C-terminal domain-containing protein [Muribaculaceae bacterium]
EGLFGDRDLARETHGLDIIIGGHSHDRLPDNLRLPDADGDSVLVVQTGKYGNYLGEITVDLASGKTSSRNIPVNSRLDRKLDPEFTGRIRQWRDGVDSLYRHEVARVDSAAGSLNSSSQAMLNFAADFVAETGRGLIDGVQGAITNKGGLRVTWHPGAVTEGEAIDMMPFANKITVIDIKGSDLLDALAVMAGRGGDAVSDEFDIRFDSASSRITAASLAGKPIAPDATYRIATIDYLANGGDYMTPFTHARKVAESTRLAYDDLLRYLERHPVISPDGKTRMREYCLTVPAPHFN